MSDKLNIVERIARKIVKKKQLLANPNKYIKCSKRKPNQTVFLRERHLKNCKVLESREKMLELIPKNGVFAEVGVAQGYYSRLILDICKPKKLYMIEYSPEYVTQLKNKFAKEITAGTVKILQGDSVEMLKILPDKHLDFVYLDATHDYRHPKAELEICKNKVKEDGIIAGHDYTRFSMWEQCQYGVVEAVNEFVIKNNYEFVFLTLDMLSSNSTYAIQKSNFTS